MNIDEARFKVLEQNVQALTQAVYKIIYSLSDLKLLLAQQKILVHPEEKSDIPEHSLFAQAKASLEREDDTIHTEPAKDCKACNRFFRGGGKNPPVPPGCRGDYYGAL
jgi:hypothetical protein